MLLLCGTCFQIASFGDVPHGAPADSQSAAAQLMPTTPQPPPFQAISYPSRTLFASHFKVLCATLSLAQHSRAFTEVPEATTVLAPTPCPPSLLPSLHPLLSRTSALLDPEPIRQTYQDRSYDRS